MKDQLQLLAFAKSGKGTARGGVGHDNISQLESDGVILVGEHWQVVGRYVQGLRVRCRIVQRVPQVVQERVALPSKPCLNVTVRETLAMQEVACRDANGVRREAFEGAVTRLELEDRHGGSLEEDGNLVVCDEAPGSFVLS